MPVDFDRLADIYDGTRSFAPELIEGVAGGVLRELGEGSSLLDIGSGTGRFLLPIAALNVRVFGVDISEKMLRRSVAKGAEDIVRGDACKLPFREKSFDGSLIVNLLHLVPDWKTLLGEAARVSQMAVVSIDLTRDERDPIDMFKRIASVKGFEFEQPSPRENELAEICPPDRVVPLGDYTEHLAKKDVLGAFRDRSYSFQTEISDSLVAEIVREMDIAFDDEIVTEKSLGLLVWKPDTLLRRIGSGTFRYPQGTTF